MMFEAGKTCTFVTTGHDGETRSTATVLEVDGPLLKVSGIDGEQIINTHSYAFKSAHVWTEEEEAQAKMRDQSISDLMQEWQEQ